MPKKLNTVSTSKVFSSVANNFDLLPKKITKEVLTEFLALIEKEVVAGNKVRLEKLGIIQTRERASRRGRNPQTGEEIVIPASRKISFRVSKSLKQRLSLPTRKKKTPSK